MVSILSRGVNLLSAFLLDAFPVVENTTEVLMIFTVNTTAITIQDHTDIQKIDKYAIVTHEFSFESMTKIFNAVEGKYFPSKSIKKI